ncbi:MAG: PorP/SprF family type IX secretion system membrane protein [Paludibacteraceae bacterium]|nr:PorP/SprF family type IX secretion system membrane protein [Paludibacteraceae bacterium]
MKKYIPLICFAVACAISLNAQTDPQIGQYMFLKTTYNPAAAGEGDLMRIAGMHRMQFTGMSDLPMTTYFTVAVPFPIAKTKHAAGVRFLNDMYGLFSNQSFHVQYAYRHQLGKGYIAAGIDIGFANISFDAKKVNIDSIAQANDGGYHKGTSEDEAIPTSTGSSGVNGMGFDLGLGLYYSAPTWWASVSYSHLTQPKIHWSDQTYMTMHGTLYVAGGYNWRLHNPKWVLKPSLMMMTDFTFWDINLNLLAEVKNRYRFGAGYRIAGSVNFLLCMDIINGLQLGYTYELPANRLIRATYGSHELFLAYAFSIVKPKRTNKYKSVRYL